MDLPGTFIAMDYLTKTLCRILRVFLLMGLGILHKEVSSTDEHYCWRGHILIIAGALPENYCTVGALFRQDIQ